VFGIPQWAIGVGVILVFGGIGVALMVRLLPPETWQGKPKKAALGVEERESLEELRHRVGELEERVDFAERLLAKQRDAERLAPPQG
jgi:hypothetical protein